MMTRYHNRDKCFCLKNILHENITVCEESVWKKYLEQEKKQEATAALINPLTDSDSDFRTE